MFAFLIALAGAVLLAGIIWGAVELGRWIERRRHDKELEAKDREIEEQRRINEEQKAVISSLNKLLEAALEKVKVLQNENAALEQQLSYKSSASEADKKKIAEQALKLNKLQTVCDTFESDLRDKDSVSQELKSKNTELFSRIKNLKEKNRSLKQEHSVNVDDYKSSIESDANWQAFNNFG